MKITKEKAYIILTPNTPRQGDVGLEMINYTEDPSVDTISYGIRWLVTHNPELLYYIVAREMDMELIDRVIISEDFKINGKSCKKKHTSETKSVKKGHDMDQGLWFQFYNPKILNYISSRI